MLPGNGSNPAAHWQARDAAEPVVPPVPELRGHAVHAAEPVTALKVSAAHAAGVPPSGPVNPASARQSLSAAEPAVSPVPELAVDEFTGQAVHGVVVPDKVAPP